MRKKIFFCLAFLIVSQMASAQFIRLGVKGGVNVSSLKVNSTTLVLDGHNNLLIEKGEARVGLHFGVVSRIQILGLFIQPELIFTQSKGELLVSNNPNSDLASVTKYAEQKFNKLDIPILVGWTFGKLRIGVGPVASFMLNHDDGLEQQMNNMDIGNVKNKYHAATFGYQAGVGLDLFKHVALDFKYEGNLSKLSNGLTISDKFYPFDQRNPQYIFSLGIFF